MPLLHSTVTLSSCSFDFKRFLICIGFSLYEIKLLSGAEKSTGNVQSQCFVVQNSVITILYRSCPSESLNR